MSVLGSLNYNNKYYIICFNLIKLNLTSQHFKQHYINKLMDILFKKLLNFLDLGLKTPLYLMLPPLSHYLTAINPPS